jgi:hypothetical protein
MILCRCLQPPDHTETTYPTDIALLLSKLFATCSDFPIDFSTLLHHQRLDLIHQHQNPTPPGSWWFAAAPCRVCSAQGSTRLGTQCSDFPIDGSARLQHQCLRLIHQ